MIITDNNTLIHYSQVIIHCVRKITASFVLMPGDILNYNSIEL